MRRLTKEETTKVSGAARDLALASGYNTQLPPVALAGPPGVSLLENRFNGVLNAPGYER